MNFIELCNKLKYNVNIYKMPPKRTYRMKKAAPFIAPSHSDDLAAYFTGINKGQSMTYLYPPNGPKVPVPFHPPYAAEEYSYEDDLKDHRAKVGADLLNTSTLNLLNPFAGEVKFYDQVLPEEQMRQLVYERYKDMKEKQRILKGIPDPLKPIVSKILEERGSFKGRRAEDIRGLFDEYVINGQMSDAQARDVLRIIENNSRLVSELDEISQRRLLRELEATKEGLKRVFVDVSPDTVESAFNRAVIRENLFNNPEASLRENQTLAERAVIRELQRMQEEATSEVPGGDDRWDDMMREDEEGSIPSVSSLSGSSRSSNARSASAAAVALYEPPIIVGSGRGLASSATRQTQLLESAAAAALNPLELGFPYESRPAIRETGPRTFVNPDEIRLIRFREGLERSSGQRASDAEIQRLALLGERALREPELRRAIIRAGMSPEQFGESVGRSGMVPYRAGPEQLQAFRQGARPVGGAFELPTGQRRVYLDLPTVEREEDIVQSALASPAPTRGRGRRRRLQLTGEDA